MGSEHINALKVGAVIEEYRVERLLGHGGFGMTYLARDMHLNTLVAIKEYLPQEFAVRSANSTIVPKSANDEQGYVWGLDRFKQEARALARFKHPHIVRASRLIEANGTAYMVMDYEHGLTLGEYIKKHGPTLEERHILGVFLPILEGIHALHKAELVHRDIKPGNIYIRAEGGPMLIDFGAVRHAVGAHSRSLTAVVTPGYAPIEQYSSEGKQGPWTDLYAVGATMYTCILGRSPIDAARRSAAISDGDPDPLVPAARVGKGKYSDELLSAIDWALQFRTRDRPQTAIEFRDTLRKSPVAPEGLDLPEHEEDKTAMGTVPREAYAAPAPFSTPQPHAPTMAVPRPAGVESATDGDVASAPMEWFDPPPSNPPSAPRGQPTRDPDDDPLSQSNAGLISAAAAGDRVNSKPTPKDAHLGGAPAGKAQAKPAAQPARAAPPAKPAAGKPVAGKPAAGKPVAGKPVAGKPAGGGLIANAAARGAPQRGGGLGWKLVALAVVLGAAAAGAWWYQTGAAERRDAKLWASASRSGSVAGFEAYLEGCETCAKRADAEGAIAELKRQADADAASEAQLQRIAELKTKFAQHLIAGEIDAPAEENARSVLEELGRIAPDDVFVVSGRERLALLDAERKGGARPAPVEAKAPEPKPAEPVAEKSTADAKPAEAKPTETKVATAPVKKAAAKPKPSESKPAVEDPTILVFELLAKFESALANRDLDGGPQSASVTLRAMETLAPGDVMVRDARIRYEKAKARQAAAPAPATTAPAPTAPVPSAPVVAPQTSSAPPPATGATVRDSLGAAGQGPALVMLAAGAFRMGDLAGTTHPDEQPVLQRRIRAIAIGKREVTVGQFRAFVEATRYVTDAERGGGCRVLKEGARARDPQANWRNPPFAQSEDHPVVCVSASDAGAYAAWLAQVTGGRYRLPTEAEWEYAARAGSETPWWWGADPASDRANCRDCGARAQPHPVESGTFDRNGWGLHDVAGNAAEWTCSAYEPTLGPAAEACVNLRSENQIVMRGGSWSTSAELARSSARGFAAMSWAADDVGFRVVREY